MHGFGNFHAAFLHNHVFREVAKDNVTLGSQSFAELQRHNGPTEQRAKRGIGEAATGNKHRLIAHGHERKLRQHIGVQVPFGVGHIALEAGQHFHQVVGIDCGCRLAVFLRHGNGQRRIHDANGLAAAGAFKNGLIELERELFTQGTLGEGGKGRGITQHAVGDIQDAVQVFDAHFTRLERHLAGRGHSGGFALPVDGQAVTGGTVAVVGGHVLEAVRVGADGLHGDAAGQQAGFHRCGHDLAGLVLFNEIAALAVHASGRAGGRVDHLNKALTRLGGRCGVQRHGLHVNELFAQVAVNGLCLHLDTPALVGSPGNAFRVGRVGQAVQLHLPLNAGVEVNNLGKQGLKGGLVFIGKIVLVLQFAGGLYFFGLFIPQILDGNSHNRSLHGSFVLRVSRYMPASTKANSRSRRIRAAITA